MYSGNYTTSHLAQEDSTMNIIMGTLVCSLPFIERVVGVPSDSELFSEF